MPQGGALPYILATLVRTAALVSTLTCFLLLMFLLVVHSQVLELGFTRTALRDLCLILLALGLFLGLQKMVLSGPLYFSGLIILLSGSLFAIGL